MYVHPMSGAGRIKFDGSDPNYVVEVKDAPASYRLQAAELDDLWKSAVRQGKEALFIIEFTDSLGGTPIRAVIHVERTDN